MKFIPLFFSRYSFSRKGLFRNFVTSCPPLQMYIRISFLLLLFLLSTFSIQAQHRCLTDELHRQLMERDPAYRERYTQIQEETIGSAGRLMPLTDTTILIPVVVHVIQPNGIAIVTEEQIQSQLDVLNEDYALLNSTSLSIPSIWLPLAKDSKIRFTLAQRDPAGQPTNGITRSSGNKSVYNLFDPAIYETDSGGQDAWSRDQYLNIWVCPLVGNALGYANFPGSAPLNDGIVINPIAFGRLGTAIAPYNLGRTASHEIGHWLSLVHIWGDDPASTPCSGKDFTGPQLAWDDTPDQAQPTFRCKTFPALDDCSPSSPGYMYMNYMDYTDDKCMMFFTSGQIRKCRTVLDGVRNSLKSSAGASLPFPLNRDVAIDSVLSPVRSTSGRCFQPEIRLKNNGLDTIYAVTIRYGLNGGVHKTYIWSGALATGEQSIVSLPSIGTNTGAQVMEFRISGSDDNTVNNFRSSGFTTTIQTKENCESAAFTAFPNPVAGTTFVCVKATAKESQSATVKLLNNLGQTLFLEERSLNPGDAIQINLEGFPAGLYFLNVAGDAYNESAKLIYLPAANPGGQPPNCN